ncbi:MAG: hypothetical protein JWL87_235 [Candidatus Adlerbacteria bacterium]|nr:hypothetical protein [Candidatus Adlerbacteria bacterium]
MGGLNPKFKDFADKHPDATVLGMSWALYWRFGLLVLAIEAVFFGLLFIAGATFGDFGDHHRKDMHRTYGESMGMPIGGKLNIDEVCNSALAYMTFPDASSTEVFLSDCKAGGHPEVVERYKADMNLGDGAAI